MDDHIDLRDIVRLELQAVGAPDGKVSISGPPVPLGFELVQTFALALHELATNAVKHGALKTETGRLDIHWSVRRAGSDAPLLVLDWREEGVHGLAKPVRRGFGRELIEQALGYTLRAKTSLSFDNGGVSCHIELPLPAQVPGETSARLNGAA